MIISKIYPNKRFSFCQVSHNEILKLIKNLETKKTTQQNDTPTKIVKAKLLFLFKFFP